MKQVLKDEWIFKRYAVVLAILVLAAAACDNMVDDPNPFSPTPQAMFITPENVILAPGGTLTFTVTNADTPVSWTVNNSSLASINVSSGAFTAGSLPGTVTVTATDSRGDSATATVTISANTIQVTPANSTIGQGGTLTFTATNATAPLAWSVSNTTLANINIGTGLLTAGTIPGTVTITVTDANGITGSAVLTIAPSTILVTPSALTLNAIPATAPDFDAVGNVGTVVFTMTGATGGYTGATINATTGGVTITTLPTLVQGNQALTITASDGIATSGTATLTLIAQ